MTLRSKLAIISVVLVMLFVGVGFAAWTFNKDVDTTTTGLVAITTESEQGTLTVTTASLYIILDQSGIYYATDAAGNNAITAVEANYNAVAAGNLGENMSVTFSLAFSGTDSAWTNYISGLTAPADQTETVVNGDNAISFTLPALSYTANKPSTESEYDAMVTALSGKALTLTITANAAADDVAD